MAKYKYYDYSQSKLIPVGGTFFALDGCKLPSNASKEWSGKHADLHRKKEKIEKKVEQLITEQVDTDKIH